MSTEAPARPLAGPPTSLAVSVLRRRRTPLPSDPARRTALRESMRALLISRLLVWIAGAGTVALLGSGPVRHALNPPGLTRGLGPVGDVLAAPAARWDASWYLLIAHFGYRPDLGAFTTARTAFFPLYPFAIKALAVLGLPLVVAGVVISVAALAFALYGIHRLTTLELARGPRGLSGDRLGSAARLAVTLTAFAPMALYFSAVYTESLYLALSVGVFWAARNGRWAWVGVLGALAAATRNTGVLLGLAALMLYLYGPREDRAPDAPPRSRARAALPRYRLRANVLWLALVPAGTLAYSAYLALAGGDPLSPFHSQAIWGRHFAGPFVAVWDGVEAAVLGARQLLSLQRAHVYYTPGRGSAFVTAGHSLMLLAFLALAVPALIGAWRRLPRAYGVYALLSLALPLSYPVSTQPLMSLPRFLVVLFPLTIASAAWLQARPRLRRASVLASAVLLAFFTAQFATWHWVA